MIVIAANREPVVVPLKGAFVGASVTLRRLTSNEYAEARDAALAIVRDRSRLIELLEHHDLRPASRKVRDLLADPEFLMGVGEWLGAVECGVRAISAWEGFVDEKRQPIEPTREALEVAFLSEPFLREVLPRIDAASQLLVVEGKGSGLSPNGSPAQGRTASGPTTAPTAAPATNPAPTASPAGMESSAPRRSTRRTPPKAPPSGD